MDGVVLISEVPGAGKTTVARLLAQRLPLAAHIEADEIQNLIVSGRLHPQEEPQHEAERQEVALARDAARGYKQVGHLWRHLDAEMRDEMVGRGLWLDTSELTAEETVATILARLDEALVP